MATNPPMSKLVRTKELEACFECPICKKLLKRATTLSKCLHTFCEKCIIQKLVEEKLHVCPVCNVYLGSTSIQNLRPDYNLRNLKEVLFHDQGSTSNDSTVLERAEEGENNNSDIESSKQREEQIDLLEPLNMVERKLNRTWVRLVASDHQQGYPPLKDLGDKCFICLKSDSNEPPRVALIKEYLKKKLDLHSVDEVDIFLEERLLEPSMELRDVMKIWLTDASEMVAVKEGSSGEAYVMLLSYARSVKPKE